MKLQDVCIVGLNTCQWRNHAMSITRADKNRKWASYRCDKCKMSLCVYLPRPNDPVLAGKALVTYCRAS